MYRLFTPASQSLRLIPIAETLGSRRLTIYVQADSPGADKESNWLPAPRGADFSLYVRAYWPKPAITSGKWTPPPVLRA